VLDRLLRFNVDQLVFQFANRELAELPLCREILEGLQALRKLLRCNATRFTEHVWGGSQSDIPSQTRE
jgi:hypothetical protein